MSIFFSLKFMSFFRLRTTIGALQCIIYETRGLLCVTTETIFEIDVFTKYTVQILKNILSSAAHTANWKIKSYRHNVNSELNQAYTHIYDRLLNILYLIQMMNDWQVNWWSCLAIRNIFGYMPPLNNLVINQTQYIHRSMQFAILFKLLEWTWTNHVLFQHCQIQVEGIGSQW